MRGNCRARKEDVWETWLSDLALVEHRLREKTLTMKELKQYTKWDFSPYLEGQKEIKDDMHDFPASSNGIDIFDDRMSNSLKHVWFCRGCDFESSGETHKIMMKKRTSHKNKCPYYVGKPRSPVFDHMSSSCTCCILDRDGKKRKWWRVVQDEYEKDRKQAAKKAKRPKKKAN